MCYNSSALTVEGHGQGIKDKGQRTRKCGSTSDGCPVEGVLLGTRDWRNSEIPIPAGRGIAEIRKDEEKRMPRKSCEAYLFPCPRTLPGDRNRNQ